MRISAFSTLAFGFGLGLAGTQLVACSDSSDDCNATATCGAVAGAAAAGKSGGGAGNEGGADGGGSTSGGTQGSSGTKNGGGEGGGGPGCAGDVADDAACWTTNELGVFVSSDIGDDAAGDGTREKPFASISKGVASAAGKNVYVCLGAADFYEEKLSIDADADGVHIYGGFECDNWSYSTTRYAGVQSPEPIALRIASLSKGAHLENLRFVAANGTAADKSSFGAFITDSQGVVLRRVDITAGNGMKGADGDPGGKGDNGADAGVAPIGKDAICASPPANNLGGAWESESACGSLGGHGGTATKGNGDSGGDGNPVEHLGPSPDTTNGGPGSATIAGPGGNGDDGLPGDAGTLGPAAPLRGTFAESGFSVASGKAGTNGFPGQGGGGGGASRGSASCVGASGGAGGMAGCGGAAGAAGLGGGASLGLFSWNSDVALEASNIAAGPGGAGGAGGKGGSGGAGADGGSGGLADAGNNIGKGGRGGGGGLGGNGGSGSGGTGGPSYAIAYSGTKPSYAAADTMLTAGDGGDAGLGGQVLDAKAPDGSDGDSQAEFEVP